MPSSPAGLSFEANRGQTDGRVKFLARHRGYTLFLTPSEVVVALRQHPAHESPGSGNVVRMILRGAAPEALAEGIAALPGTSNYFLGNSPSKWITGVPTYERVGFRQSYPGIDVVYYGRDGEFEFDFVVAPGADPDVIELGFEGVERVAIGSQGELVLPTPAGEVVLHEPVIYQPDDGTRRGVEGRYALTADGGIRFEVSEYDRSRPLVIDPLLSYSTLLGGSEFDTVRAITVDADGNVVVTGATDSPDFPVPPGYPSNSGTSDNVFVAKLDPSGSNLLFTTFLGGGAFDCGFDVEFDSSGNVFVVGRTDSWDFPVTEGAFDTIFGSPSDAFFAKIDSAGGLVFSSFLGGSGLETAYGVAPNGAGNAVVVGTTNSQDFLGPTNNVSYDAFVVEVASNGSGLVHSTLLGGSNYDAANDVLLNGAGGDVLLTGGTSSGDFPVVPGSYDTDGNGGHDAFLVRLDASTWVPAYSTYFGGADDEDGLSLALDMDGNAYVAGYTLSNDFPTTEGALDSSLDAYRDAFVAVLNPDTTVNPASHQLLYSTLLGGLTATEAHGIAVDGSRKIHLAGLTHSSDFPLVEPLDSSLGGSADAFVAVLETDMTETPWTATLTFSTYLGGRENDLANDIAVDVDGNPYVAGRTVARGFPTTSGALQTRRGGEIDGFVAKIDLQSGGDGGDGDDGGDDSFQSEKGPRCSDGLDNDGDTLIDGDDPDCEKGKN